jgi:peroxiredoxin
MSAAGIAVRPGRGLPGPRARTVLVIAITALAVAGVAWIIDQPSTDAVTTVDIAAGPGAPPQVGEPAPDFDAVDVDGSTVRLSKFVGKPVWLTFGASWCGDCRAEALDLQATYDRYAAQGLAILAVFIEEDDAAVREYAGRLGFTFRLISDPRDRLASGYHILGIPTHYFIGADGVLREVRVGGLHPDEMDALVRGMLD